MAEVKVQDNILSLLVVILLGFLFLKFFTASNDETWEIIRDEEGRLLSIRVKRKVKTLYRGE